VVCREACHGNKGKKKGRQCIGIGTTGVGSGIGGSICSGRHGNKGGRLVQLVVLEEGLELLESDSGCGYFMTNDNLSSS